MCRKEILRECSRGTTLIEIMVVVSLIAIIGYSTLPGYAEMSTSFDRFNARAHLLEDIKLAQSSALSQGCRGIMTIASDKKSYNFGCDFLSYDTATPPSPDSVSFTRLMPGDVTIEADKEIIFNSRGQTVDQSYVISNVTFSLKSKIDGSFQTYASGFLLGTGIFKYD